MIKIKIKIKNGEPDSPTINLFLLLFACFSEQYLRGLFELPLSSILPLTPLNANINFHEQGEYRITRSNYSNCTLKIIHEKKFLGSILKQTLYDHSTIKL